MKQIYLIRHGQTAYNKQKIVQGSGIDANLNTVGEAQGAAFFQRYQQIPFKKVYTSKLRRTHQTVAKFIGQGVPWEQFAGLNEISWGIKEGKNLTASDDEHHYNMLNAWKNGDYTAKAQGGECPAEVSERQQEAWKKLISNEEEDVILVCMHGRAIRILLCDLLDLPLSEMDNFKHTNTCLYLLHYEEETGKYTVAKTNDTTHLEGIDWEAVEQQDNALANTPAIRG